MTTLRLSQITLVYFAVPVALFFVGWVKPWFAVPILLGLGFGMWRTELSDDNFRISRSGLIAVIVAAVAWCALSGMGGLGFQNGDYAKHLAIVNDLMRRPWPVIFETTIPDVAGNTFPLVYYLGFYLPIVAFAKALHLPVAWVFFLWGTTGVALGFLWFCRIVQPKTLWPILGFPFFGGMDAIGLCVAQGHPMPLSEHWEWWAGYFQYSSNSTLLFWVPQHALSGWALAGFLFHEVQNRRAGALGWIGMGALFWSPFVAVGLLPFYAVALFRCARRSWWSIANVATALTLPFLLTYFAANLGMVPNGWIWTMPGVTPTWIIQYALFELLEVLILMGLAYWLLRDDASLLPWWIALAGMLLALPLYKVGFFSDLTMRASIPALFLAAALAWRAVEATGGAWRWPREALILVLAIGALTGLSEMSRSVRYYADSYRNWRDPAHSVTDLGPYTIQYLGSRDAFFFRYFAAGTRTR